MRAALRESASIPPVDYVHAHGTGPRTIAPRRIRSTKRSARTARRALWYPKGATGHLTGAAGAVETISCLLSLRDGLVPPTTNYDQPDPDCDLDYVPGAARALPLRTVLKTASAFGGSNASLVLRSVGNV